MCMVHRFSSIFPRLTSESQRAGIGSTSLFFSMFYVSVSVLLVNMPQRTRVVQSLYVYFLFGLIVPQQRTSPIYLVFITTNVVQVRVQQSEQ
ncbi:hypothetical protein HanIR_Chr17g0863561 [Helianthus annuus]|nr:hypothetical protein HanIR_Chr17g0863561 [Helianthus annuus]